MDFSDLTTLIIIGVSIFILVKLRSTLGKRTGHQNPPGNVYRKDSEKQNQTFKDNVIILPNQGEPAGADEDQSDIYAEIDQAIQKGSRLNNEMRKLKDLDASFSLDEFFQGAKSAYEMIIVAFAKGDKKTLRSLLSDEVYEGFSNAMEKREKDRLFVQSSFIGMEEAKINDAQVTQKEANITVRFISDIISATYDKDKNLVDGSEEQIVRVIDLWTFCRDIHSRDPNWKLVSTESGVKEPL